MIEFYTKNQNAMAQLRQSLTNPAYVMLPVAAAQCQVTNSLAILTTTSFDKCGIGSGNSLVQAVGGGRISILRGLHQAHARFSQFNQRVGEFVALLFHDAQVAESSEQTLLGLIFGVFKCPDAETFKQTAQLFVAVLKLVGFSIGSSGALSQRVVLILGCKKLSILSLDLGSGDLE